MNNDRIPENVQKEYIKPADFRKRLAISRAVYCRAVKGNRIFEEEFGKSKRIEWYQNRTTFIQTCRDPKRYSPESIKARQIKRGIIAPPPEGELIADNLLKAKELELDEEFAATKTKREAESIKQLYLAKQAKLRFLKDAGTLMETSEVISELEQLAIRLRKQFLAIPARVSEIFASIEDSKEINKILKEELTHVLSNFKYEIKDNTRNKLSEDPEESQED